VNCPKLTTSAIAASASTCGDLTAAFNCSNSKGAIGYHWDFGDSTVTSDTSNLIKPNYTYPDSGFYKIRLIAYSSVNKACNDTSTTTLTLYPPLHTNFTYTSSPCSQTVSFKDSSTQLSGAIITYKWTFGDGSNSALSNPTHVYSAVGTFTVTLVTSSSHGCIDSISKVIDLTKFNATFDYYVGCSDSVFFNGTLNLFNDTVKTVSWDFGDNGTSTTISPYHVYNKTGKFPVKLILTTTRGCTDTINQVVDVTKFKADFNYTTVPCNDSVSFRDISSQLGDTANQWNWNFGDGTTSTINNPLHVYDGIGTFTIKLTAITKKGCVDTLSKPVTLIDNSKASFNYTTIACRPEVQFNNLSINAFIYRWSFGDGTTSSESNPVHIYTSQGTYHITLVINPGSYCNDSSKSVINYDKAEMLPHFLPNSFTPNGDGVNDKFSVTGQNLCEDVELIVYNRWGSIIFRTKDITAGWDGRMNGDVISEGVYVYILKGEGWDRYGTITILK